MATSSARRIQKIPNEMLVKWLIMTVSKYICICISLQKWNKWIKVEGPDYCNSNNLFVVWRKKKRLFQKMCNLKWPKKLSADRKVDLKLTLQIGYTWKINIWPTHVNRGLVTFLLESLHVTSICSFGSMPNRTSLRECLPDSISTAHGGSGGGSAYGQVLPRVPIKNKPLWLDPRTINVTPARSLAQRRSARGLSEA